MFTSLSLFSIAWLHESSRLYIYVYSYCHGDNSVCGHSRSPDVVLNVIVFSIPWVLSRKGSSSLGNTYWYSDCNNSVATDAHLYEWWELPQLTFLSWQTRVCRDKTHLLSWQKYACCNKTFVATKLCLSWQNIFVATKVLLQQIFVVTILLSWQAYFCRHKRHVYHEKSKLVTTKFICCDKNMFVTTKVLSRQAHFFHNKTFVATKKYTCGSSH